MQITTKTFLQYCRHRTRFLFLHSGLAARLPFTSALQKQTPSSCRPQAFMKGGARSHASTRPSAASAWTGASDFSVLLCLTDLLQQLLFYQFKLHADGHLGDELVTSFLGHLFAVSQVDVTYASTALEIGQRLVGDPVTDCREERGWKEKEQIMCDSADIS